MTHRKSRPWWKWQPPGKKELQAFLGIINYLGKCSLNTASVCDPLWKLTLSRAVLTWNASYQALYDKTKSLIKDDICMKFYDKTKPVYLKIDASGIGFGTVLLQTRDGTTCSEDTAPDNTILRSIAFAGKSLISAEQRYSNIGRETLGTLHGLKKCHHYCFAREVSIITNHKPLVAIFNKDIVTLSQQIHYILLRIHQYQVRIMYKPGPGLFITDLLSWHNHMENKDEEICGMCNIKWKYHSYR